MPNQNSISLRRKQKTAHPVSQFLWRSFVEEKLNNWVGVVLVLAVAGIFGFLIARKMVLGVGLLALVIGLAVAIACLVSTELGLYINVAYAFFICAIYRYLIGEEFPVGVFVDILVLLTFLSLLFKPKSLKALFSQFTRSSVVVWMLVLVIYLLLEVFNPASGSVNGWFQSFRRLLDSLFLLFISFSLFTSMERVRRFINVLFVFSVITAIYACIQQWHGLFDFEQAWVRSDEVRFGLYFIWGDFRKWSTMSDPAAYGIAMAALAIFYTILALHEKNGRMKFIYLAGVIVMLLGMSFSGTRTANVMVVAGLGMYVLLSLNKKTTRFFAIVAAGIFVVLMYGPYSNATINRFRTSFNGSEDDSYKVRVVNRARIRPYLQSHPIGGGLGTTGPSGLRFTPGHPLAGFPPDSGYLRKGLETGWIGLAITCILYFVVLRFGVRRYFGTEHERYKALAAAVVCSFFAFYLAEFGQEAIGQMSDIVIYYPLMAMLLRLQGFPGFQNAKREGEVSAPVPV